LALVALTLLLAACSNGDLPQDTFDPAGQPAQEQKGILIFVLVIAALVFVLVEGGIVFISLRYRHRKGQERMPKQIHGNTRLEVGWTIAPAVVLAFVMVPAISMIWSLAAQPPDAMHITVKGYQWWWGFEYTDPDMNVSYAENEPITTADVMVVPLGRTIDLSVTAAGGLVSGPGPDGEPNPDFEVIHSFWAPRLFGKQDAVPNRTNHIVFTPAETGTFLGQCAEFCGLQHARMKFRIVVLEPAAFQRWVAEQKGPAVEPDQELIDHGMDLFMNGEFEGGQCIACHTIGGTEAAGAGGPDLTHYAAPTHECFAGCNFETRDVEALKAWLRDPNAVKLGAKMPNYHLNDEQIDALAAYLMSLT
jgi:cytochrome c oxidase subunit 2